MLARISFTFLSVIIISYSSCSYPDQINRYSFMEGEWKRVNEQEGREGYEIWAREGDVLKGLGFTLQDGDTVFKEVLTILYKDGDYYYKVEGVHQEAVYFKATDDLRKEVFVNEENEFPKVIEYELQGNDLKALIHDRQDSILFHFEKLND